MAIDKTREMHDDRGNDNEDELSRNWNFHPGLEPFVNALLHVADQNEHNHFVYVEVLKRKEKQPYINGMAKSRWRAQ